jgi:hypothetical protein
MIRKLMMVAAAAAMPLGVIAATGGIATAKALPTDASHDTVTCTGISGSVKFKPALTTNGTPSSSGTTSIKGALTGCTTNGGFSIVSNKVKGVLTSTSTHACTGLAGITQETGTLTVTWKASVKLVSKTSTITIHTAQGGFDNTATHANFKIPGSPGGTNSSVSGSFAGNDGGASSTTDANSVETLAAIGASCGAKGLKAITLANPTDGHPAAVLG